MQTWLGGSTPINMPNFLEAGLSKSDILQFFKFSKCQLPALSWIFKIAKFYWLFEWRRSRHISTPNFVKIGQSVVKVLRFFVFQDRGCHRLGLSNSRNFNSWRCLEVQTHHNTKFCYKRSFRYGDIAFWRIFKMAAAAILDFWNREILLAIGWRGSRRISMPNFVKIGQSVAKILRFFDLLRWRPPLSWIVKFAKFYWLMVFGGAIRITVPNIVKIGFCWGDIAIFKIFKMAAAAILDFWNREILLAI